jgi:hypothetical protein
MLATFCLRLACGLIGSLLLFSPRLVNPRFFRVHFLAALGLITCAVLFPQQTYGRVAGTILAVAGLSCFVGSVLWSLERARGGFATVIVAFLALAAAVGLGPDTHVSFASLAAAYSSAALLGTATTAMLMGHSYLIAPAMSLTPLLNLLRGLFAAVALRMVVSSVELWSWTASHWPVRLEDETVLLLPVRWGVGLIGPLILGYMAWRAAGIRSTQSATGILYVVVICCFLGELLSQLLAATSHYYL